MTKNLDGSITLQSWEVEALEWLQRVCGNTPYFVINDKILKYDSAPPTVEVTFVYGSVEV